MQKWIIFLCQWVNDSPSFHDFSACLLWKNGRGSVLAAADLLYLGTCFEEIENLGSDRDAERSNSFEYRCDKTLFSICRTSSMMWTWKDWTTCSYSNNDVQMAPQTSVVLSRCWFRPWLLAKKISKAVGDIWGGKCHSCARASFKIAFYFSKFWGLLPSGIAYSEMEERMRTGSVFSLFLLNVWTFTNCLL